jgi:succinate dehydrogenase / fumarate reductase cytochrome b subunit
MFRLIRLFRTSIGSKLVAAATGTLLLGFLLVHMAGNLVILQGQNALNAYAAWMQGHPLLWGFRFVLLALFAAHVTTVWRLARGNSRARPVDYRHQVGLRRYLPPRLMLLSGLLVLGFLVLHLLHLTTGWIGPDVSNLVDGEGRTDVYARITTSFSDPLMAGAYLAAMALLGLHLLHAVESLFQTFGFNHESYAGLIRVLAPALTLLIVAGFATVPLLVLAGIIPQGSTG